MNKSRVVELTEEQRKGEFFKDVDKIISIARGYSDAPSTQIEMLMTALSTHLMHFSFFLDVPFKDTEQMIRTVFDDSRDGTLHAIKEHLNKQ